jgi:3-oxoacyl-[acyl-carrier-protein] synthase II
MSRASTAAIAIVGASIHVPGSRLASILDSQPDAASCPPESAHELLGRRGLLNKDAATRLALCAVHRALGLPPGAPRAHGDPDPRVAVVASSNLGNLSTVQAVAQTLRESGLKSVSALDAPNASSNVLASTVAIWFRCGGPNLLVCSGATSGLDAVHLARTLLLARRADRAIVVGAEPGDPVAEKFHERRAGRSEARLLSGAAALVLERTDSPGATAGRTATIDSLSRSLPEDDAIECGDDTLVVGPAAIASRWGARHCVDIVRDAGDPYGALGVLQLAIAARRLDRSRRHAPRRAVIVSGDVADGWRLAALTPPSAAARSLSTRVLQEAL